MSDIYLIMNLPKLQKAEFNIYNLDFATMLEKIFDKEEEHAISNDNERFIYEPYIVWTSIILPALKFYCYGNYVSGNSLLEHDRRLDNTDFTFNFLSQSAINLSIKLANHKLSIRKSYKTDLSYKKFFLTIDLSHDPISAKMKEGNRKTYRYDFDLDMILILETLFDEFGSVD